MYNFKSLVLIIAIVQYSCFSTQKTVVYCGKEYREQVGKVYLKDEGIETTMVQVIDKKRDKFQFGYHISAMRNDTNFIYSKILVNNDTITRINYHQYNITEGTDSSIAKFICTKKGITLYKMDTYKGGVLVKSEHFKNNE